MNPWLLAAAALLGLAWASRKPAPAKTSAPVLPPAPPASDVDIALVADRALQSETDPSILRSLAVAMRILPMGTAADPTAWNRRRAALEARATALEAPIANAQAPETFAHVRQF